MRLFYRLLLVFLHVFSPSAPASRSEELVPLSLQKQLFVDDCVVAETLNVTRELEKIQKVGAVMKPSVSTDLHPTRQFPDGLPATGSLYGEFGYRISVLWDEQHDRFQMWYRGCYGFVSECVTPNSMHSKFSRERGGGNDAATTPAASGDGRHGCGKAVEGRLLREDC